MKLKDLFLAKFGTTDAVEICRMLAASAARVTRRVVRKITHLSELKIGTEKTIHLSRWEVRQIWARYHHCHPDSVDLLWSAIFRIA
jgi:hypothetical protein